jgi:uncharacterized membrane protein YqjE
MAIDKPGSFVSSLANTAVAGLAIIETRLALLAVETQQQARLFVTMMCLLIGAVLALGFALFFLSALVIVAFWDSHRVLATGLVGLSFALLALALFGTSVYLRRTRPRWLSSSISEIAKDIAAIRNTTQ